VVPGARSIENAEEVVAEVKDRLNGEPPRLIGGAPGLLNLGREINVEWARHLACIS
jgi:hypothetical protein